MNNDNGKAYYGIGLDNSQLQQDAEEASRILANIGTEAEQQSASVREALTHAVPQPPFRPPWMLAYAYP